MSERTNSFGFGGNKSGDDEQYQLEQEILNWFDTKLGQLLH
jgi:hypothetical protein